jgi:hypothetical protein
MQEDDGQIRMHFIHLTRHLSPPIRLNFQGMLTSMGTMMSEGYMQADWLHGCAWR